MCEAFGGSTGLFHVEVDRGVRDLALDPKNRPTALLFDVPRAVSEATGFPHRAEDHTMTQIDYLLDLYHLVLEGSPPVLGEAAKRHCALEGPKAQVRHVPNAVRRVEVHHLVEVMVF